MTDFPRRRVLARALKPHHGHEGFDDFDPVCVGEHGDLTAGTEQHDQS